MSGTAPSPSHRLTERSVYDTVEAVARVAGLPRKEDPLQRRLAGRHPCQRLQQAVTAASRGRAAIVAVACDKRRILAAGAGRRRRGSAQVIVRWHAVGSTGIKGHEHEIESYSQLAGAPLGLG
jgi:hypothetical protein